MANITNPANIPADLKEDLKDVLRTLGPELLAMDWPEGIDPEALTDEQLETLFELCTRRMWTLQVQDMKVRRAVAAANAAETPSVDVFAGPEEAATPDQ